MWLRQKTKIRVNLWMLHIGILFPREGKGWSKDLPTGKETRKGQQSTGQCRPSLQPNIKRNFPKDSKLFGQMDQVNERSRHFRYCFGLSTGVCRDPSSAETTNSIQPVQRRGRIGGFGGRETSEEGGYRGDGTLQKSVSFKHLHNTQEGWREEAGSRHEGPEQFHGTCSFQNERSFALAINPMERGFMCKIDLQDAYQTIPIAKVSLERETVPVHMSTFWLQILSKNFYKGSETPIGLPQSSGSSSAGVFR